MAVPHNPLPNLQELDQEALVALILAQQEQISSQQEQLLSRDAEIEHLKLLIAKLRRMKFGRSSEKLDRQIEQLELRLEELQTSQAENPQTSPNRHSLVGQLTKPGFLIVLSIPG